MTKQELAVQIFLRRMPSERYNNTSKPGFIAKAKECIEIAELFMEELNAEELHARLPNEELTAYDLKWEEESGDRNDGVRVDRCSCNFIGPDTGRCPRHSASEREKEDA